MSFFSSKYFLMILVICLMFLLFVFIKMLNFFCRILFFWICIYSYKIYSSLFINWHAVFCFCLLFKMLLTVFINGHIVCCFYCQLPRCLLFFLAISMLFSVFFIICSVAYRFVFSIVIVFAAFIPNCHVVCSFLSIALLFDVFCQLPSYLLFFY